MRELAERMAASAPVSTGGPSADDRSEPSFHDEPQRISAGLTATELAAPSAGRRENVALFAIALLLGALAAGASINHWLNRDRARAPENGTPSRDRVADYVLVLSRAVADLDPQDGQARRAICDRARRILREQLRSADPPLDDATMMTELSALEAAVVRLDLRTAHRRASAPGAIFEQERRPVALREPEDRAFTPRFGSGAKRSSARRRFSEIATSALRSAQRLGRPA
jgi:hypothetical protein